MTKKAFQSFAKSVEDGSITVVSEDELYEDDHPYVKAWPEMFGNHLDLVTVHAKPEKVSKRSVEQATAEPGEKRDVEKPHK
jgi:chloramphenicol 3-O-phosphotransferase